jgi:hypothetical protein
MRRNARTCFLSPEITPQPELKREEKTVKVPLFKGDLGGSESDWEGEKTRPSNYRMPYANLVV